MRWRFLWNRIRALDTWPEITFLLARLPRRSARFFCSPSYFGNLCVLAGSVFVLLMSRIILPPGILLAVGACRTPASGRIGRPVQLRCLGAK
jgi:hypothetical protein